MATKELNNRTGRLTQGLESFDFIERRTIWLTEEITRAVSARVIRQIRFLDRKSRDTITIMINSPGGSITDGLAICDMMKAARSPIATICCGQAISIAAVILACGRKGLRKSLAHSDILIQQDIDNMFRQEKTEEIAYLHMQKKRGDVSRLLTEMTGQPLEKVVLDTRYSSYLSPEEAIEYGLIDAIL